MGLNTRNNKKHKQNQEKQQEHPWFDKLWCEQCMKYLAQNKT